MEKSFKNISDNWECWADVFTENQKMVFEGSQKECVKFFNDHNPYQTKGYKNLFMIGPHKGRKEDFSEFDC